MLAALVNQADLRWLNTLPNLSSAQLSAHVDIAEVYEQVGKTYPQSGMAEAWTLDLLIARRVSYRGATVPVVGGHLEAYTYTPC